MVSLERENFPGRNDQDPATPPSGILRVNPDMRKFPHFRVSAAIKSIIIFFFRRRRIKNMPHFDEKRAYAAQEDIFVSAIRFLYPVFNTADSSSLTTAEKKSSSSS